MQPLEIRESDELLVNLVHDLRQPLGNIQASTYLLNGLIAGAPASVLEQVQVIQRQAAAAELILQEFAAEVLRARAQRTGDESFDFTNSESAAVT